MNFHLEDSSDPYANKFTSLIQEKGFSQHLTYPAHICGGILDLSITREKANDNIDVEDIIVTENIGTTCDNFLIGFTVPLCPLPTFNKTWITKDVRELSKIDIDAFKNDLKGLLPDH